MYGGLSRGPDKPPLSHSLGYHNNNNNNAKIITLMVIRIILLMIMTIKISILPVEARKQGYVRPMGRPTVGYG